MNGLQKWAYAIGAEKKKSLRGKNTALTVLTKSVRKTENDMTNNMLRIIKAGGEKFTGRKLLMAFASGAAGRQRTESIAMNTAYMKKGECSTRRKKESENGMTGA